MKKTNELNLTTNRLVLARETIKSLSVKAGINAGGFQSGHVGSKQMQKCTLDTLDDVIDAP